MKNEGVWLVFVVVKILSLRQVVRSTTLGMNFAKPSAFHKDRIQLIVDGSGVAGSWDAEYDTDLGRTFVPVNMIVLYWTRSGFSPNGTLIREKCACDDLPSFTPLPHIFSTLAEPNGVQKIAKQIRKTKMDFRGRTISIFAGMSTKVSWESE